MKDVKRFKSMIENLAARAGVDLYEGMGAYIKVEVDSYMPLVIETVAPNQVAISHYYMQNGDVMHDPEVVLFTGYVDRDMGWVPMIYQQDGLGIYQVAAKADRDNITHLAKRGQADLARFVNQWGRNLKAQGFFGPDAKIIKAQRSWQAVEREQGQAGTVAAVAA